MFTSTLISADQHWAILAVLFTVVTFIGAGVGYWLR